MERTYHFIHERWHTTECARELECSSMDLKVCPWEQTSFRQNTETKFGDIGRYGQNEICVAIEVTKNKKSVIIYNPLAHLTHSHSYN
jgi:hypothetical protein